MMRKQAGGTVLQLLSHRMVRQFLRAISCVGCTPDRVTAGAGDHVVHRWNFQFHDREDRRIGRMGVNHRLDFRPSFQDIEVKAPFT